MSPIDSSRDLAATIRELYGIVGRLENDYEEHHRHFTLDGHLVGSIGEVYAAEKYGIKLFTSSAPTHDGKAPDGRLVQIKVTQRGSVGISERPDYLLVLSISKEGEFEEVYNGLGERVWKLFENRKPPKNGQYQVSLGRLRKLDSEVEQGESIPVIR